MLWKFGLKRRRKKKIIKSQVHEFKWEIHNNIKQNKEKKLSKKQTRDGKFFIKQCECFGVIVVEEILKIWKNKEFYFL